MLTGPFRSGFFFFYFTNKKKKKKKKEKNENMKINVLSLVSRKQKETCSFPFHNKYKKKRNEMLKVVLFITFLFPSFSSLFCKDGWVVGGGPLGGSVSPFSSSWKKRTGNTYGWRKYIHIYKKKWKYVARATASPRRRRRPRRKLSLLRDGHCRPAGSQFRLLPP